MGTRDPRIDAYIERAEEFARPILTRLREVVHAACPGVEETLKWGMPYFMYDGMLCGMASFRQHCAFHFWRGSEVVTGPAAREKDGMGQLGRIRTVKDLPSKRVLTGWIRQAMTLNEAGVPTPRVRARRSPRAEPALPTALAEALRRDARARRRFDEMTPGHRREYIQWIAEAKREETRERRAMQALEQIAEGRSMGWKYEQRRP